MVTKEQEMQHVTSDYDAVQQTMRHRSLVKLNLDEAKVTMKGNVKYSIISPPEALKHGTETIYQLSDPEAIVINTGFMGSHMMNILPEVHVYLSYPIDQHTWVIGLTNGSAIIDCYPTFFLVSMPL